MFRASDGLKESFTTAVSFSPRGKVWLKHGEADAITYFNGYSIGTFPTSGRDNFRIYESRTAQLWSLYSEGLVVSEGRQWIQHPIAEIRHEMQSDPLRQIRQIPLVPAERNRIFFLVSDRLMDYDSSTRKTTVIRHVNQTQLGRFYEMTESHDNGLWITGARGLAKLPGPLRQINSDSRWQEFLIGPELGIENLQRPFEDTRGGVTAVAFDRARPGQRMIAHFDGGEWKIIRAGNETIRQAWRGWDDVYWAFTVNSLLRIESGKVIKENISAGRFEDVALATNGVFWIASSEGLLRFAPHLWRRPIGLPDPISLVHSATEDAQGRLWISVTEGLARWDGAAWSLVFWPDGYEPELNSADQLFPLADGRIAIAAKQPLVFSPSDKTFQELSPPEGGRIRLLGQVNDGNLCVLRVGSKASGKLILDKYDGRNFTRWLELSAEEIPDHGDIHFAQQFINGDLWLGGSMGLAVYRAEQLHRFTLSENFILDRALCLLDPGNGRIWCGGPDRILEFDGKTWSSILSGVDRVNEMIRTRDGKIWVATTSGTFTYWNGTWLVNGVAEGLPTMAVYEILQDRQGRIWAGTTQGLALHHPDADLEPPVGLEPLLDAGEKITTETAVTFAMAGRDKWQATDADRLLFSYRMDQAAWSPYTNGTVKTFSKLGAGTHRFEVRAMDRNWNESSEAAGLEFSVIFPWYKERRLIATAIAGFIMVLFFAGLAVNRHLRLLRSYAEVEKIVTVRTRELERATQELVQSQKMKALGTMAAGIAHDFNNILSIIKGSAQIIEANLEDKDKVRLRLNRIKTVVEQGSGIVKSMLGLSRVNEKDYQSCELNSIVEETIKLLGDRFLQDVNVVFQPEPGLPPVVVARELIQQILLNLILNAADAMGGGGKIVLRTGIIKAIPPDLVLAPGAADDYVQVEVEDSGTGIAPEILPRIFEPFFTTKALSTRRGTGLGLSMVYELAKQMQCGLAVQSQVGKGTVFTMIIPVKGNGEKGTP
ncbi:MAG: ATP-binding protein [Verrucomicrobiota bacterium]